MTFKNVLYFSSGVILTVMTIVFISANYSSPPVEAEENRDVFYPGTEEVGPNEIRVVALGTGMPNARPKQAAACWLVELGNGDKFLFDLGTLTA